MKRIVCRASADSPHLVKLPSDNETPIEGALRVLKHLINVESCLIPELHIV